MHWKGVVLWCVMWFDEYIRAFAHSKLTYCPIKTVFTFVISDHLEKVENYVKSKREPERLVASGPGGVLKCVMWFEEFIEAFVHSRHNYCPIKTVFTFARQCTWGFRVEYNIYRKNLQLYSCFISHKILKCTALTQQILCVAYQSVCEVS